MGYNNTVIDYTRVGELTKKWEDGRVDGKIEELTLMDMQRGFNRRVRELLWKNERFFMRGFL